MQARVGLELINDAVVVVDKFAQHVLPRIRIKETVLIDVGRQELLEIPHFYSSADVSVFKKVASRRNAIGNGDNDRIEPVFDVAAALLYQQVCRCRRAMNRRVVNDEITRSAGLVVGIRRTVDFNGRHKKLKLCGNKMLQNRSGVFHAGILPLPPRRLLKQAVHRIGNTARGIFGKLEWLPGKILVDARDPVVFYFVEIDRLGQAINELSVCMHKPHVAPVCTACFFSKLPCNTMIGKDLSEI